MNAATDRQLINDLKILSSDEFEGRKNQTVGGKKSANFIAERFAENGLKSLTKYSDYYHHFSIEKGLNTIHGINVIGFIEGTARHWIVITAHYDHLGKVNGRIHPGADDNASGVAAMLTLANAFKRAELYHPLLFVATDAEEKGLFGAEALFQDNVIDSDNVLVNINLDMLAQVGSPPRLYLSGEKTHPLFDGITDWLNNTSRMQFANPIRIIKGHRQPKGRRELSQRINYRQASDHGIFANNDIAYLFYGVGDHRFYHQPTDRFENINVDYYQQSVAQAKLMVERVDQLFIEHNTPIKVR